MELAQDGKRPESAALSEFRFCLFQDGAVGVGALPERKELLVLRARFSNSGEATQSPSESMRLHTAVKRNRSMKNEEDLGVHHAAHVMFVSSAIDLKAGGLLQRLAKDAEIVCAADLADLVWGETRLQHGIDYDVVEAGGLICPREIRAFSDPWLVLARGKV